MRLDAVWIPAIALTLGLTLVHAVYWSNMRMRGPVMPMVYVAAMAAFRRRDTENFRSSDAKIERPG